MAHAGGRPSKITEVVLAKLRNAFIVGATDVEACASAKIDITTLYRYEKKNPEFCKEKADLKRNPILKARTTIYNNLKEPATARWFLERKLKDEFSTKSIIEDINKDVENDEQINDIQEIIKELRSDVKSQHNQPN